jgi:hypothetical protein
MRVTLIKHSCGDGLHWGELLIDFPIEGDIGLARVRRELINDGDTLWLKPEHAEANTYLLCEWFGLPDIGGVK